MVIYNRISHDYLERGHQMMRKVIVTVAMLALLAGCSSLPAPEQEGNSLVIGRLILDFPDGFFKKPARTVMDGIKTTFLNVSRGEEFSVYTSDGYFYFLSNGTDEYVFQSFKYSSSGAAGSTSTIGPASINKKFKATPGSIVYVSDLVITYKNPDVASSRGGGAHETYEFDISADFDWNTDYLRMYIAGNDRSGAWLDAEVVEVDLYGQ
jgi:hypothetical protein